MMTDEKCNLDHIDLVLEANIAMQVRVSSLGNDDKDAILGVTAVAK